MKVNNEPNNPEEVDLPRELLEALGELADSHIEPSAETDRRILAAAHDALAAAPTNVVTFRPAVWLALAAAVAICFSLFYRQDTAPQSVAAATDLNNDAKTSVPDAIQMASGLERQRETSNKIEAAEPDKLLSDNEPRIRLDATNLSYQKDILTEELAAKSQPDVFISRARSARNVQLRNKISGELLPNHKVEATNLVVLSIKPLRLRFKAETKRTGSKIKFYLQYQSEIEHGTAAKRWFRSSPGVGRSIKLLGRQMKMRRIFANVTRIAGDVMDSDSMEIDFDLLIGDGLPVPISLVGTNIWEKEIGFGVELFYPPLSQNYADLRINTPWDIGDDRFTIIQITNNKVTLKSGSNDDRTTLTLKTNNPIPASGKSLNLGDTPGN